MIIATAWAQEAASTATAVTAPLAEPTLTAALFQYAPIVFIFVIFYVLVIRPQGQAAKEHQKMLQNLKKGDIIVTDGGLVGEVTKVAETLVHVRVNPEDTVSVVRSAVRKTMSVDEAKGWEPTSLNKKK